MYSRFDNANKERYKIKKIKINEIQFKDPEFNIKFIILLDYIHYLNFLVFINFKKFQNFYSNLVDFYC